MRATLARFQRNIRTPGELSLLAGLSLLAVVLPLLMRLPLPRLLRVVDWINRCCVRRPAKTETVLRYVDALGRIRRWSLQDNCVVRSLLYYTFLNSRACPLELRFGVEQRRDAEGRPVPGRRHVWVMRNGEPLNETISLEEYVLLFRYPEQDRGRGKTATG